MSSLLRVVRVLVLLVVATIVLTLTIALSTAETGLAEKGVLVGLIAACVYFVTRVPKLLGTLESRLRRS